MIYIREDIRPLFADEHGVDDFLRIDGEVYKHVVQSRRTLRFERGGKAFFLKAHWGVGWREIFKNLLSLRLPVLGARNEWLAIRAMQRIDVDTMTLAAYGQIGLNPATQHSFLITDALEQTEDLETWLPRLQQDFPSRAALRLKRAVIRKVATIARRLRMNGINHRDFYLCHFRIDLSEGPRPDPSRLRIYLMDLHRAQLRRKTPQRWIVKDIAALLYSALCVSKGLRLTRSDYLRFLVSYYGDGWRSQLAQESAFWRMVMRRTIKSCARDGIHGQSMPRSLMKLIG